LIGWIIGIGVIASCAGVFVIASRLQRAKQIAATEEARKRMLAIRDSTSSDTSDRMRDGDF